MAKNSIIPHTYDTPTSLARIAPALDRARELVDASLPENTRRLYGMWWTRFSAFCSDADARIDPLEASPELVAAFLASLDAEGVLPQSIASAYSGVSFFLRAHNEARWPFKQRPFAVARVIKGAYQKNGRPPVQKKAFSAEQIGRLMRLREWPEPIGARNRALLLVGFCGALRRSELAAMQREHLTVNRDGLRILIPRSKTDQRGQGQEVGLLRDGDPSVCPVQVLRAWCIAGRVGSGFVFRAFDRGAILERGIEGEHVAVIVKQAAEMLGLKPDAYGGHSLRRGLATEAAHRGRSLDEIMKQGRWQSAKQALSYIEPAQLFERNASAGIMARGRSK